VVVVVVAAVAVVVAAPVAAASFTRKTSFLLARFRSRVADQEARADLGRAAFLDHRQLHRAPRAETVETAERPALVVLAALVAFA
jgi:hypothetical protein